MASPPRGLGVLFLAGGGATLVHGTYMSFPPSWLALSWVLVTWLLGHRLICGVCVKACGLHFFLSRLGLCNSIREHEMPQEDQMTSMSCMNSSVGLALDLGFDVLMLV
jgi:hypothetical protein